MNTHIVPMAFSKDAFVNTTDQFSVENICKYKFGRFKHLASAHILFLFQELTHLISLREQIPWQEVQCRPLESCCEHNHIRKHFRFFSPTQAGLRILRFRRSSCVRLAPRIVLSRFYDDAVLAETYSLSPYVLDPGVTHMLEECVIHNLNRNDTETWAVSKLRGRCEKK